MADGTEDRPQATSIAATQTISVSQFALGLNPSEFLLSVGHSRVVVNVTGGMNVPEVYTEWLATLSMSPTATKGMVAALQGAITEYERQFGTIPMDPKFTVSTQ
ncbi:hypothetical protein [Methylobacterium sp. CM6247]